MIGNLLLTKTASLEFKQWVDNIQKTWEKEQTFWNIHIIFTLFVCFAKFLKRFGFDFTSSYLKAY